jgi:hypothetical protein
MKKFLIPAALLCLGVLQAAAQENPSVTIVNNTGYTVYYLYISQTSTDDWEEDVLGDDVLLNGQSVNVKLAVPLTVTNRYDIKLQDSDGDTYIKWDVPISNNDRVIFTMSDITGGNSGNANAAVNSGNQNSSGLPSVRIVNNTGYTVYYLYVSQTATDDWEEDVLGNDVLYNGQSVNVRLAYPLTVTNRYDIKMEDVDGDSYTKWNVLITPNATVEFTIRDLD